MIEICNLQFGYNGTTILHGIHIEARAGTIVAVAGPNGSGKTTLLKCICGINRKWTGRIRVDGREIAPPIGNKMADIAGYMPQQIPFGVDLTVFETILLGNCTKMVLRPGRKEILAVDQVMREMGIRQFAKSNIGRLSGGERQRVFIAQALVRKPQILFLDEPTSSLDLRYQFEVLESIKKVTKHRGMTTIIVMHDLNLAARYADRIVVLAKGRIVRDGRPEDVLTPGLIRNVYGVRAMVAPDDSGRPWIQYAGLVADEITGLETTLS